MNEPTLIANWNIDYCKHEDPSLIVGSPNRSSSCFIFSDTKSNKYIAEGFALSKQQKQDNQTKFLEHLKSPTVYPHLRTPNGDTGVVEHNLFWQLRPYMLSDKLDRDSLPANTGLGVDCAKFLLNLKDRSTGYEGALPNKPFRVSEFLPILYRHARRTVPEILDNIRYIESRLSDFLRWDRVTDQLVVHGDFHPGNVLTAGGKLVAVIDWEFCGTKFPGYDMCLMLGCLGMDNPDNLTSPLVKAFQDTLHDGGYMNDWSMLEEKIAATRLGWLGEWLTLKDVELIKRELRFINYLLR